jgi:hypothetical protein
VNDETIHFATCMTCNQLTVWVEGPVENSGWWSHLAHPDDDDHDAVIDLTHKMLDFPAALPDRADTPAVEEWLDS